MIFLPPPLLRSLLIKKSNRALTKKNWQNDRIMAKCKFTNLIFQPWSLDPTPHRDTREILQMLDYSVDPFIILHVDIPGTIRARFLIRWGYRSLTWLLQQLCALPTKTHSACIQLKVFARILLQKSDQIAADRSWRMRMARWVACP